jgi:hypothetical protein
MPPELEREFYDRGNRTNNLELSDSTDDDSDCERLRPKPLC